MSESVLARVPVHHSGDDDQPMAANDRKLHAVIEEMAVLGRYFPRRSSLRASGDLPAGGRRSGGAGGANRGKNSSRCDSRLIHGL